MQVYKQLTTTIIEHGQLPLRHSGKGQIKDTSNTVSVWMLQSGKPIENHRNKVNHSPKSFEAYC